MAHRKTLSNLRVAIRDNLDESAATFWTNAQLTRFINRAKDYVWMEVKKLKADYFEINRASTDGALTILSESYAASSFQIPASATTFTRTLPPDMSELKRIEVITTDYETVEFTHKDHALPDFRALRTITDTQPPHSFLWDVVGERTLVYTPYSDTALDLRLWYVPILADLSADDDTLEMPHPTYLMVEELATSRAQIMDRDTTAAVWEQLSKKTVAAFFGGHARQTQDPEFVESYLSAYTGW